mmetsp:Transcript_22149/g.30436  ORF Transcript_22149/g.30436 Transcript_22149/m.30436 type:complete len:84 (-) Transcript_22149:98-349(-)
MDFEENKRLRERYLRFWKAMVDTRQPMEVRMYEGTQVQATLVCVDGEQEALGVEQLQTPVYTYPRSVLRSSDLIYCEFSLQEQ